MSIQSDVILLGVCLLLLLVSTYLFYKLKKVKSYYQGQIEALEKENMGALSNDPRNSNDWKVLDGMHAKIGTLYNRLNVNMRLNFYT